MTEQKIDMAYFEYVLFVNVILQSFSMKTFPSAPLSILVVSNNKYQLYIHACVCVETYIL
jgi:hypothetical protein